MDMKGARAAVDGILNDLSDRRGLRQEWERIDDDIQDEIKQEWALIIYEQANDL